MSSDHDEIFGRTFSCECGRTHGIDPREVLYAADALEKLPAICARATSGRRAAVLMDVRTREAAGSNVCAALATGGWQVIEQLVPDPAEGRSPVCDDVTKDRMSDAVRASDLVVSVGAGVLTDLGRWIAAENALAFVSFATAASMNGYTSPHAAAMVKGIRVLEKAHPPYAVVADPDVIRHAPYELTAAGLGDILARPVSANDWYLTHLLFDDYYCDRAANLINDIEPAYMQHAQELKARSPETIETLFRGLLVAGVAMTMAGSSAPCSGGEHLISHTLDMMSTLDGTEHDLHGRQVGVGTVLASELYRRVLALESPTFVEPSGLTDRAFWGDVALGVQDQYENKVPRLWLAVQKLAQWNTWDNLRERLSSRVREPETTSDCLSKAGAAWRAEHIGCSRERLLSAFLHAHEMRTRFTILDLARLVGIMPHAAREIVETWA